MLWLKKLITASPLWPQMKDILSFHLTARPPSCDPGHSQGPYVTPQCTYCQAVKHSNVAEQNYHFIPKQVLGQVPHPQLTRLQSSYSGIPDTSLFSLFSFRFYPRVSTAKPQQHGSVRLLVVPLMFVQSTSPSTYTQHRSEEQRAATERTGS